MGDFNAPQVGAEMGIEELRGIVARLIKEVQFLMDGNLSSTNAREFGGWRIGMLELMSKDKKVGMSTDEQGLDPIRFWAGDVITGQPVFYVTKSGKIYAANGEFAGKITAKSGTIGGFTIDQTKLSGPGIIEGGTIRTGPAGTQRIELTGGILRGMHSSDKLHGLVFNPSTTSNFFDLFIYHDGVKLLEFIDNSNNVVIRPATSIGMYLGGAAGPTKAIGTWDFSGCAGVTGTIPGNCSSADYAASSGTATTVPSTGITPGTYPKATFAADGRATAGGTLVASDIPSLDFGSKISGKPTTLAGYGITDAVKALSGGTKIQSGKGDLTVAANAQSAAAITFPQPFATAPIVLCSLGGAGVAYGTNTTVGSYGTSATGTNIAITSGTAQTLTYTWLAIGT